jgi:hypothetical protein
MFSYMDAKYTVVALRNIVTLIPKQHFGFYSYHEVLTR